MASLRRVVALVQRFEAASSPSASPLSATAATHCDADVAEGTVRELVARFNGMARSMPDFPRPAYTRSMRAICSARVAVLEELVAVTVAEPERRELLDVQEVAGGDEPLALALRCDGEDTERAGGDLGSERDVDDGVEGEEREGDDCGDKEAGDDDTGGQVVCTDDESCDDDDDDDDESLLTNAETASIASLSSSFVSDSSCDDLVSEAADLYYELEYRSQTRLHIPSESAAALPDPIAVHVTPAAKQPHDGARGPVDHPPTAAPRTLLPSRIPVRRGSTLRAPTTSSTPKAAAPSPATPSVGSEAARSAASSSPPRSTGQRCEPSVPRSPATLKTCSRCAAASSSSVPRALPKRSERRGSMSDVKTQAGAPAPRRSSVTAPAARFHSASASGATVSASASANLPAPQPRVSAFIPINARARSRSREASARPPTPPVSSTSTLVVAPSAEIRLDGVKSRLFDYESDPKRLELVAANRARRKSLEVRAAPTAV